MGHYLNINDMFTRESIMRISTEETMEKMSIADDKYIELNKINTNLSNYISSR